MKIPAFFACLFYGLLAGCSQSAPIPKCDDPVVIKSATQILEKGMAAQMGTPVGIMKISISKTQMTSSDQSSGAKRCSAQMEMSVPGTQATPLNMPFTYSVGRDENGKVYVNVD